MYTWIFVTGIIFAFYNSWGIGANDCANSFATSVGSKVLTLRQAIIIAAIFEFSGAVFMGSHVTNTVRKKIVDIDLFDDNPGALMYGMLCADLASAIWLTIATYFKLPVSTTHSIIGAIVGFSLAYGGSDAVNWEKILLVIASWVASPFLAGLFSGLLFFMINKFIFQRDNSYQNTIRIFPVISFFTLFINTLFIIYKGSPQLDLDEIDLWVAILSSFIIGTITAILVLYLYIPYIKKKIDGVINDNDNVNDNEGVSVSVNDNEGVSVNTITIENTINESVIDEIQNTDSYIQAIQDNTSQDGDADSDNFVYDNDVDISKNIEISKKLVKKLEDRKYQQGLDELYENSGQIDEKSERVCSFVQVATACFSSFAHGSNDVANSIAPLATIYHIYQYNNLDKKSEVPIWILVLGGIGIVFGLSTWGYKIIGRMGNEITKISASRGFIIELSAALTIIIASRAEIPVSTTHCQVGGIVGCGLVGGIKNIKWTIIKKIVFSWLITLPVTGFLSAGLFSYGYYSPYENENYNFVNLTTV